MKLFIFTALLWGCIFATGLVYACCDKCPDCKECPPDDEYILIEVRDV